MNPNKGAGYASWRDYYELCKPRVVLLMLVTAWVGMALSTAHLPSLTLVLWASFGIACCASSAAVINHLVEVSIDKKMRRTQNRPLAGGRLIWQKALLFSLILGGLGFAALYTQVNPLTAWLTLSSQLTYALFYTLFLKHATPQNIVIGGIAGAAPPLLGWTSVTNAIDPNSLLLVLIIFAWTPPHFWALALYRQADYEKSGLPMLPVTHGVAFTKLNILLYTLLLICTTLFPFIFQMSGLLYLAGILPLNAWFFWHTWRLYRDTTCQYGLKVFWVSIWYLLYLFILLLADHYMRFAISSI